MLTRQLFNEIALQLYEFCEYPAVRYKILFHFLDTPYEDDKLQSIRSDFMKSDIIQELYQEQEYNGGWGGRLEAKNYKDNAKFPTTLVAVKRCLYIGLTIEDSDILLRANEYLEDYLKGKNWDKLVGRNERALPWRTATVCENIESIQPDNPLCDRTFGEWLYIAIRSYENGEYSYDRERAAQHEIFYTRDDRLIPMQFGLLLKRRDKLPPGIEESLLHHHGERAYHNGWFWCETPKKLPETFEYNKTRRWFATFNYINQFRGSAVYLADMMDWLIESRNTNGLWDWGTQIKDPWGYYGYFSTNRNFKHNRIVDCTMEILSFLKTYLDHNE